MAHHALQVAGVMNVEFQAHGKWSEFGNALRGHSPANPLLLAEPAINRVVDCVRPAEVPRFDGLDALLTASRKIVSIHGFAHFPNGFAFPYLFDGIFRI